uniref:Dynein light intermediate chain n=1 Tax=Halisarca dujardinii TaxID=2583056 RepID=A0A9F1UCT3_HALDU|nr:cytoplasmic dynein 1 light intermediate chain [Halisarca dujardinii]
MSAVKQGSVEESSQSQQSLWSTILNEVSESSARCRMPSSKTLIVLGEVNSGKSVLVDKLCESSHTQNVVAGQHLSGCCLEYRYFDVRDEETDDWLSRMGVWILDGVVNHSSLLEFALKKDSLRNTLALVVVDLSKPWDVIESLKRWTRVLSEHVDSLQLPPKDMAEMEKALVDQFRNYVDPDVAMDTTSVGGDKEDMGLPLDASVLTNNLGIPIIVVGTKSDQLPQVEKERGFKDEHHDFIQQHIRRFCLRHGASLVYTSSKEDRNCEILQKYIVHRAYGLSFKTSATVVERDAIFIPSGWDSEKKISILSEHMKTIDDTAEFSEVIQPAAVQTQSTAEPKEVWADDDQMFLQTLQVFAQKPTKGSGQAPRTQQTTTSDSKKAAVKTEPGEGGKETVLANFFNSLLAKGRTGSGKPPTKDAAAEYDKMSAKTDRRSQQ